MDALNGGGIRRLLKDHDRLERIFDQVIAAFEEGDRETMAERWTRFDTELIAHMDAEERFLIPILFRMNERAARSIVQEHRHIRGRLVELGTCVDLHTLRLDTARTFIKELRAHASSEDALLYQWADENVAKTEQKSLFEALRGAVEERIAARIG